MLYNAELESACYQCIQNCTDDDDDIDNMTCCCQPRAWQLYALYTLCGGSLCLA